MNNFWVVLSHTYFSKVKTKQFIISTVITLIFILGLANITKIIDYFSSLGEETTQTILVIDETKQLGSYYIDTVKSINEELVIELTNEEIERLDEKVLEGEIKGYVVLDFGENGLPRASYHAESLSDFTLPGNLEAALQQLKFSYAANQLQMSQEDLILLNTPAEFEEVAIGENVKTEEELSQARGLVYILLFFIYFSVMMYATMIATEVATEKSSRVMEILISSVSPVTQMFAKIIGVGLVGLTQMVIWLGIGYLSLKQNLEDMTGGFFSVFGFENASVQTIIYAIVFFLLGFFLYATIAALLGSLVSRIEDVSQSIMPLTWLIVIGFMLAMFGLYQPDATFVTVTSYIPFFTPMIMFMRIGLLDLPFWEPILGILILLGSIALFGYFGGKVYRGGVLMYGNVNVFKGIKRALQLGKRNQ